MHKYFVILIYLFTTLAFSEDYDCKNPVNTIQINYCAGVELTNAKNEMNKYFLKSKEHNSYDLELIKSIDKAQKAWAVYSKSHCDSIYTMWREGTIRGLMHITCETKLTKQRTHDIWSSFLTYMDSTAPVLPEPKITP